MSNSNQAKQDRCRALLSGQDSIMEPTVHSTLGEFLKVGGSAIEVITSLSESYAGLAPMCDLVSTWGKELDMDGEAVMRGILRELLMEKFDPQSVDEEFMSGQTSPDWLDQMIEDPFWRQVIYELSEKYQQCLLLNFAIQKISDAGHQGEIAKIAAAAVYINVFNGVLKDSLEHIREEDDVDVEESIPDFVRTCCANQQTYLYTQVMLKRLSDEPGGLSFRHVSKELEKGAMTRHHQPPLVSQLRMTIAQAPPNIAEAVNATLSSKNPTPGDVMTLYKAYTVSQPPLVQHLRDPELFEILMRAMIIPPKSGQPQKSEIKERLVYLVAYAASVKNEKPGSVDKSELTATQNTLKALDEILSKKTTGADLNPNLKEILKMIEWVFVGFPECRKCAGTPVASLALLIWLQYILMETSFYETYFRTNEALVPHMLLDEVGGGHRDMCFWNVCSSMNSN
ncbi:TH1 protein [Jimgerdemannia flammicorona]|uniref:TH1 protein n=1 Tax=Jimgerdemannia flammicorona TaxID=994334 RepID=A0A433D9K3_9FUNG|nr:TH1 protein [Jimgerdemannia flammicorona]